MTNRVITWNTTKTDDGFRWTVYSFGYQQEDITLKTGVSHTRAIATKQAKRWTKWLKNQAAA